MSGTIRIRGNDPPPRRSTQWMSRAACHATDAGDAWTPDHKPAPAVLQALRQVCESCPVISDCAQHALDQHIHGGFYAGVWLPHRHDRDACDQARNTLHWKTAPLTKGTACTAQ